MGEDTVNPDLLEQAAAAVEALVAATKPVTPIPVAGIGEVEGPYYPKPFGADLRRPVTRQRGLRRGIEDRETR